MFLGGLQLGEVGGLRVLLSGIPSQKCQCPMPVDKAQGQTQEHSLSRSTQERASGVDPR